MVMLKRKFAPRLKDVFERGKSIFGDKQELRVTGHCASNYEDVIKYIEGSGDCKNPNVFYFNFKKNDDKKTIKNNDAVKAIVDRFSESILLDVNIPEYLEFAKEYADIWEKEFGEGKATVYY